MKKKRKLKYKWMLTTTVIMFLTILFFCFIIIFFLKDILKDGELDEAERSSSDIVNLLQSRPLDVISPLDLSASLENFQEVILYNEHGKQIIHTSNDNAIQFHPKLNENAEDRIRILSKNGVEYLVLTDKVKTPHFNGYVVLVHSLQNYNNIVNSIYIVAIAFCILATIITAAISYIFSAEVTKPIVKMSDKMIQIRRDGFQNKLELNTNYEETDNLVETFNGMMSQIEESFNQQRQFVEDASHELRTPLQIIQGHLNLIQRWGKKDPEVLEESLNISIEEMNRITKLVEELLMLTKDNVAPQVDSNDIVDINDEIRTRIKSLKQLHPDYHFEMSLSDKPINTVMNRHQFEQLLLIFIDNAMKYDVKNKFVKIETMLKNKQIILKITDHGLGIPASDQEFIFDRFYRVDKSRARSQGGNGLGLSIADKIATSNDGYITVESELNQFTTFTIYLKNIDKN